MPLLMNKLVPLSLRVARRLDSIQNISPFHSVSKSSSKRRQWVRSFSSSKLSFQQTKNDTSQQAMSFGHSDEPRVNNSEWSITNKMEFIEPFDYPQIPMYRVLNEDGSLASKINSSLTDEKVLKMYHGMLKLNTMDRVLLKSQRQGRISFYMTSFGEEAAQFGVAGSLEPEDWIYAQYREPGLLIYRGADLDMLMAQNVGNKNDLHKGRQMPVHYGSKDLNYVTISSTLATQMPQAVGTAYVFKHDNSGRVVTCFFGEGAASEGDAHAAMNFAPTLGCPVIFVCRNNGFAISTPASEQYCGDGIAPRALGYGMRSIRVDGNDLFAMYLATHQSRKFCVEEHRPVLIEAITYRTGHHSTSDDSSFYRSKDEVRERRERDSPISRVYRYLEAKGVWNKEKNDKFIEETREQVLRSLKNAGDTKKLPISSMFEDVYDEIPSHIKKQQQELVSHLKKYGDKYPLNDFDGL